MIIIWGGYDFVDDDDDPLTTDVNVGHGTLVASVAVGEGVNKVVGVAYNASYYAVRVLDDDGLGPASNVLAGIQWASTEPHKADIISMSLGMYDQPGDRFWLILRQQLGEACNNAYDAGVILVAASGNDDYNYSAWPARFGNVISVGAHGEYQEIMNYQTVISNGGVDVIAPGARVYSVKPDNSAWWIWGTSYATPHASALIALQLQYARQNNITVNNGYVWEVMQHSAHHLTGETYDPVYQGKGKAWAAETLGATDPDDGAIDLMANNWPLDIYATFTNAMYELDGYPAYYPATDMVQDVNVVNVTDVLGSYSDDVVDLTVTTRQRYYQREGDNYMPADANEVFPSTSINSGQEIKLSDSYYILAETVPGLNQTTVEFDFQFSGNTRQMHIAYNGLDNARWLSVEELTADFEPDGDVDLSDFSVLSGEWARTGTLTSDIAPEPVDGVVDILDLLEFTSHWLEQTIY